MHHPTFEATTHNFDAQVLQSSLPVLIEFTADWCPPCKMLTPILHQIASHYAGKLRVGLLDTDAHPAIMQRYSIMGLPTLMLFVNGEPVERIVGFTPRARIEAKLLPYLTSENA